MAVRRTMTSASLQAISPSHRVLDLRADCLAVWNDRLGARGITRDQLEHVEYFGP
jgi:hypothetical protein